MKWKDDWEESKSQNVGKRRATKGTNTQCSKCQSIWREIDRGKTSCNTTEVFFFNYNFNKSRKGADKSEYWFWIFNSRWNTYNCQM